MSSPVRSSSAESPQVSSEEQQQQTLPDEQTLPEEQQQQTLFNLRIPHLMNTILNGKPVPLLVLAFPFDSEDKLRCAEVNNLSPESDRFQRQTVALCRIRDMLPQHCDIK
ncbi:hypothetical protein C0992_001137, partial [Termitomyces sp. T32_za158]